MIYLELFYPLNYESIYKHLIVGIPPLLFPTILPNGNSPDYWTIFPSPVTRRPSIRAIVNRQSY